MNEKFQKPPWKTSTAFRDLVLISAIFILVSVLVYVFGAFEAFQEWIREQPQWEAWHIHDYLFVLVILAFALGVFALRRWIELKREIAGRKRAEAALRASEERFRSVAQSATDAIIVANSQGNIISWNTAAQTIFGYGEEEALGKPVSLLMPERFHDSHRRGLERFFSTGESHVIGKTVEFAGRKKDGSEFPLELSLASWKRGEETSFTGIIRDISERRRVQQERERLITELQQALADVKQLSGLLPICAGCKKIRDDRGYWNQVESYIAERTAAKFTHGLCPACSEKYFPGLTPEELNRET